MTPEEWATGVMYRWHQQVIDTTTPLSGDDVLQRDIAEAVRQAVAEAREDCADLFLSFAYDPDHQKKDPSTGEYMIDADKIADLIRRGQA